MDQCYLNNPKIDAKWRVFLCLNIEKWHELHLLKFKNLCEIVAKKTYNALPRVGYNLNVMLQSACLVINPITVDGYAALFNFTPVDRASDSMMAPT